MSGTRGDSITLAPELARNLARLRGLPADERAYGARRLALELRGAAKAFTEIEKAALVELRADGLSWHEIAALVDLPFTTVHNTTAGRKSRRKVTPSSEASPEAASPA